MTFNQLRWLSSAYEARRHAACPVERRESAEHAVVPRFAHIICGHRVIAAGV